MKNYIFIGIALVIIYYFFASNKEKSTDINELNAISNQLTNDEIPLSIPNNQIAWFKAVYADLILNQGYDKQNAINQAERVILNA